MKRFKRKFWLHLILFYPLCSFPARGYEIGDINTGSNILTMLMGVPTWYYQHVVISSYAQTHLAQLVVPPSCGKSLYKLLWTLITIIVVSVQWHVRLTTCRFRLVREWVGGWEGSSIPTTHLPGGDGWCRVPPCCCGCSSFCAGWWAGSRPGWGCAVLDRLLLSPVWGRSTDVPLLPCLRAEPWLYLGWAFDLLHTMLFLIVVDLHIVALTFVIFQVLLCRTDKRFFFFVLLFAFVLFG